METIKSADSGFVVTIARKAGYVLSIDQEEPAPQRKKKECPQFQLFAPEGASRPAAGRTHEMSWVTGFRLHGVNGVAEMVAKGEPEALS